MRNSQNDGLKMALRRQMALERSDTVRPVFSRGRRLEAAVDWGELPLKSSQSLTDEDGNWWFLAGVSDVGGGDRIPP